MSHASRKLFVAAAIVTGGFVLALPFRRTEEFKTQHAAWETPSQPAQEVGQPGQEVGLQPYLVRRTAGNPPQDDLAWTPSVEPSAPSREYGREHGRESALPFDPLHRESETTASIDRAAVAASAASLEIEAAPGTVSEPMSDLHAPAAPPAAWTDADEDSAPYRMYVIQNGDSLPKLAARYLGSVGRALELFDLNREVLSNPHLLPIGAEIRIPRENHLRRK